MENHDQALGFLASAHAGALQAPEATARFRALDPLPVSIRREGLTGRPVGACDSRPRAR